MGTIPSQTVSHPPRSAFGAAEPHSKTAASSVSSVLRSVRVRTEGRLLHSRLEFSQQARIYSGADDEEPVSPINDPFGAVLLGHPDGALTGEQGMVYPYIHGWPTDRYSACCYCRFFFKRPTPCQRPTGSDPVHGSWRFSLPRAQALSSLYRLGYRDTRAPR